MKPFFAGLCMLVLAHTVLAAAADETVNLASGAAVTSHRFAGQTNRGAVVLWLTGQDGRLEEERRAAAYLSGLGLEVWLTDWLAPYFLPQAAPSIAQVPEADLVERLETMRQRHAGRPLALLASGHATSLPLRATAAWQSRFNLTDMAL